MNILFLLSYYKIGGVETVTHVLANGFADAGHNCVIFSFSKDSGEIIYPLLSEKVCLRAIDGARVGRKQVVVELRRCLTENNIDVVINQSGDSLRNMYYLKQAAYGKNIRIVSKYHNMPLGGRTYLKRTFRNVLSAIKQGIWMRFVYWNSDKFVLLSKSFIPCFKRYTMLGYANKLCVIPNPVTSVVSDFCYRAESKRKELLFVGRLERNQKRVDRILAVWDRLYSKYPDWRLIIVGDGPDRIPLQRIVEERQIERVDFEGFQRPDEYYKHASILVLTSDYEGFGLVIVEAMNFGVVPVVYGSYPAVYDIIDNEQNGYISAIRNSSFDIEDYIEKLETLMSSPDLLSSMARNAMRMVEKQFSLSSVIKQWEEVLR